MPARAVPVEVKKAKARARQKKYEERKRAAHQASSVPAIVEDPHPVPHGGQVVPGADGDGNMERIRIRRSDRIQERNRKESQATTVDGAAAEDEDSDVDPTRDQDDPTMNAMASLINTLNIVSGTPDPPSK